MTANQAEEIATAALAEAKAVFGVCNLARGLGVRHPSISKWRRVPAERVIEVERLTGVPRTRLRPDLYPAEEAAA